MNVKLFYSGGFASNCYLVISDDGREAVLIDPSVSYDFVFRQCPQMPQINKILLTHAHFDHVLYLDEWCEKTGARVYATQSESEALTDAEKNANLVFLGINKAYNSADKIIADNTPKTGATKGANATTKAGTTEAGSKTAKAGFSSCTFACLALSCSVLERMAFS